MKLFLQTLDQGKQTVTTVLVEGFENGGDIGDVTCDS